VRPFLYWRDPLFAVSCGLYALNRFYLKPHFHSVFLRSHFNDVLLIPCALPLVLLLQRWLRLRGDDDMPNLAEIGFHLGIWCVLFEVIGPRILPCVVGDAWDMVAYCAGGVFAALWWNRHRVRDDIHAHEL
jgi:hypothetical protein